MFALIPPILCFVPFVAHSVYTGCITSGVGTQCAAPEPRPLRPDGPPGSTGALRLQHPRLKSDTKAEAFLAQDLSALDFSQFRPVRFEFEKKNDQINMRVPNCAP